MTSRRTQRGDSLIAVVIGLAIVLVVTVASAMLYQQSRRGIDQVTERMAAHLSVAELAEFFRSMSPGGLLTYLSTNPVTGSANPNDIYPFCAHINILDRESGKLVNKDPLADLPAEAWMNWPGRFLAGGRDFTTTANRYYQVFVVDMRTLQIDETYCSLNPSLIRTTPRLATHHPNIRIPLTHKFMVTVGVTWLRKSKQVEEALRNATTTVGRYRNVTKIVASAILPGPY